MIKHLQTSPHSSNPGARKAVAILGAGLALLGACLFPPAARADINLAEQGPGAYTIIVAPDASPTVNRAARELSSDLQQMTGAMIPVATGRSKGPAIFVGESPATQSWRLKLNDLPAEGFVIRTRGRNLALAGHDDRGTMYAVYTFLEDYLGARWYAPDATILPHHTAAIIPNLNVRESPAFDYRDTDEHIVSGNAAWDAHLKLDGTDVPDDPTLGSINRLFNGAENFYQLVPPAKYFATHPEYFSLIDGKRRSTGDSQLCLTNPDVFKIVTDALIEQARQDPKLLTLGLSPNDAGDGSCQCDNCKASDALYGAPSGTLIHFVNQVAAAVQAALPGRKIWVETLAYQYTEPAPRPGSIAPASNVLVCLAPIYACDGHPLATDPQNAKSNTSLLNWSKVAPGHLQVWHYVTNFANYLQPYPDWDELGADMPYYRANGVSGMFCEGDYNSPGSDTTMRTWVMAHLFWNPHQDVWKLVRDFCDGYYGPAGADIYQIQRLYHDRLQQPGVHLHLYDPPNIGYLTPETLQQVSAHMDHALAAADTPVIRDRVEEATLPLRYVELMQTRPGKDASPEQRTAFKQKLDPFVADLHRFHVDYTSEGGPASNWIASMEQSAGA